VMDWGLAKVVDQPDPASDGCTLDLGGGQIAELAQGPLKTLDGAVVGTPTYMPPEQARGNVDKLDRQADVYSLGAILYEMLTLQPPYEGDSVWNVLQQVLEGKLVPPVERTPERAIAWELAAVVSKAMAHTPSSRYSTVEQLKRDIEAWIEGRTLGAARYSQLQLLRKWAWRNRRPLAAAVLILAAVVGGGLAIWQHRKAQQAGRDRVRAEQRAAEQKELRQIEERVGPLVATMEAARPYFYIPKLDISLQIKKVRQALDRLEKLSGDPELSKRPDLWEAIGKGRFFIGDLDGAEAALLEASSNPQYRARVATLLGRVYMRRALRASLAHRKKQSKQHLQQAGHWFSRVSQAEKDGLQSRLVEALSLLAAGRKAEAAGLAGRALRTYEAALGSEEFQLVIAKSQLKHERALSNRSVIKACSAALERRPHGLSWAYSLRGHARFHQGDLGGAISDYDRALEINPQDAIAYCNRGLARGAKGDHDGAIEDFGHALEIDPRYLHAYNNRGIARDAKGDFVGAIADFDQAIKIDSRDATAYYNRASTRRTQGDLDGAIADYDRAIENDPGYATAYNNRGTLRQAKRDLDGAVADYSRAIQLDPRFVNALNNRGSVREGRGDHDGAIADYNQALEVNPRYAKIYHNRGNARDSKGDFVGAIADFDQALEIDPSLWRTWANRGLSLARLGKRKEASPEAGSESCKGKARGADPEAH